MSGFENYARQAEELEHEIARKGIALGIDWDDEVAVRRLARAAIDFKGVAHLAPGESRELIRCELFGLMQLMLQVMKESAEQGLETHGGPVWKVLARALWAEHEAR